MTQEEKDKLVEQESAQFTSEHIFHLVENKIKEKFEFHKMREIVLDDLSRVYYMYGDTLLGYSLIRFDKENNLEYIFFDMV